MASLFEKFKPWLHDYILEESPGPAVKPQMLYILKALPNPYPDAVGSCAKQAFDGDVSITALFTAEALKSIHPHTTTGGASSSVGNAYNLQTNWDRSRILVKKYSLSILLSEQREDTTFVLKVDEFTLWNLEQGFTHKIEPLHCMEMGLVKFKAQKIWIKARESEVQAVKEAEMSMSSVSLTQLLREMGEESQTTGEVSLIDVHVLDDRQSQVAIRPVDTRDDDLHATSLDTSVPGGSGENNDGQSPAPAKRSNEESPVQSKTSNPTDITTPVAQQGPDKFHTPLSEPRRKSENRDQFFTPPQSPDVSGSHLRHSIGVSTSCVTSNQLCDGNMMKVGNFVISNFEETALSKITVWQTGGGIAEQNSGSLPVSGVPMMCAPSESFRPHSDMTNLPETSKMKPKDNKSHHRSHIFSGDTICDESMTRFACDMSKAGLVSTVASGKNSCTNVSDNQDMDHSESRPDQTAPGSSGFPSSCTAVAVQVASQDVLVESAPSKETERRFSWLGTSTLAQSCPGEGTNSSPDSLRLSMDEDSRERIPDASQNQPENEVKCSQKNKDTMANKALEPCNIRIQQSEELVNTADKKSEDVNNSSQQEKNRACISHDNPDQPCDNPDQSQENLLQKDSPSVVVLIDTPVTMGMIDSPVTIDTDEDGDIRHRFVVSRPCLLEKPVSELPIQVIEVSSEEPGDVRSSGETTISGGEETKNQRRSTTEASAQFEAGAQVGPSMLMGSFDPEPLNNQSSKANNKELRRDSSGSGTLFSSPEAHVYEQWTCQQDSESSIEMDDLDRSLLVLALSRDTLGNTDKMSVTKLPSVSSALRPIVHSTQFCQDSVISSDGLPELSLSPVPVDSTMTRNVDCDQPLTQESMQDGQKLASSGETSSPVGGNGSSENGLLLPVNSDSPGEALPTAASPERRLTDTSKHHTGPSDSQAKVLIGHSDARTPCNQLGMISPCDHCLVGSRGDVHLEQVDKQEEARLAKLVRRSSIEACELMETDRLEQLSPTYPQGMDSLSLSHSQSVYHQVPNSQSVDHQGVEDSQSVNQGINDSQSVDHQEVEYSQSVDQGVEDSQSVDQGVNDSQSVDHQASPFSKHLESRECEKLAQNQSEIPSPLTIDPENEADQSQSLLSGQISTKCDNVSHTSKVKAKSQITTATSKDKSLKQSRKSTFNSSKCFPVLPGSAKKRKFDSKVLYSSEKDNPSTGENIKNASKSRGKRALFTMGAILEKVSPVVERPVSRQMNEVALQDVKLSARATRLAITDASIEKRCTRASQQAIVKETVDKRSTRASRRGAVTKSLTHPEPINSQASASLDLGSQKSFQPVVSLKRLSGRHCVKGFSRKHGTFTASKRTPNRCVIPVSYQTLTSPLYLAKSGISSEHSPSPDICCSPQLPHVVQPKRISLSKPEKATVRQPNLLTRSISERTVQKEQCSLISPNRSQSHHKEPSTLISPTSAQSYEKELTPTRSDPKEPCSLTAPTPTRSHEQCLLTSPTPPRSRPCPMTLPTPVNSLQANQLARSVTEYSKCSAEGEAFNRTKTGSGLISPPGYSDMLSDMNVVLQDVKKLLRSEDLILSENDALHQADFSSDVTEFVNDYFKQSKFS